MIDVIMLAKGDNHLRQMMTQRAINTVINNDKVKINVIVVETMAEVKYQNCTMINPDEKFNYNKFTKLGYRLAENPYIFFINNDTVTFRYCTHYLRAALDLYDCACPINTRWPEHGKLQKEYTEGFEIWQPSIFQGWAFMMKRETIDVLGIDKLFPDEIHGWYSDNVVTEVLKNNGMRSVLVRSAKMDHLQSVTLKSLDKENMEYYTHGQRENYDKWLSSLE